jgi:3-oxoacyl-[acyl-carrier protein] reductase
MDDLNGRLALVTGASRGIGRAIALALADSGADVVVNYLSRSREAQEVQSQITRLGKRCIARPQAIEDIAERDWDDLIDVNLKSAFLMTQEVLPGMRARQWSRIVNVSSVAAQVGGVVGPHYAASCLPETATSPGRRSTSTAAGS